VSDKQLSAALASRGRALVAILATPMESVLRFDRNP
jgi:hypothetical protein